MIPTHLRRWLALYPIWAISLFVFFYILVTNLVGSAIVWKAFGRNLTALNFWQPSAPAEFSRLIIYHSYIMALPLTAIVVWISLIRARAGLSWKGWEHSLAALWLLVVCGSTVTALSSLVWLRSSLLIPESERPSGSIFQLWQKTQLAYSLYGTACWGGWAVGFLTSTILSCWLPRRQKWETIIAPPQPPPGRWHRIVRWAPCVLFILMAAAVILWGLHLWQRAG